MIMKLVIRSVVGFMLPVLFFISCGSDYTLDVFGSISGTVTDSVSGDVLSAVQVTLVPGANTVQTSSDGAFSFSSLEEGQYTISVQKEGYQANRKNVSVISGETTEVVVTLSVIPKN